MAIEVALDMAPGNQTAIPDKAGELELKLELVQS
jgi:hypothetical protein